MCFFILIVVVCFGFSLFTDVKIWRITDSGKEPQCTKTQGIGETGKTSYNCERNMGIKTKERRFVKALLYRLDRIHISAVPRTIQICHMLYSHGQKYVRISQMQNVHWPIGIQKQVRKSSWVNQLKAQSIRVAFCAYLAIQNLFF